MSTTELSAAFVREAVQQAGDEVSAATRDRIDAVLAALFATAAILFTCGLVVVTYLA
jgi:hypothetical protein